MKYLGLSTSALPIQRNLSVDTFPDIAGTPLGKLLTALLAEKVWSRAYSVAGYFYINRSLVISHPLFPTNLWIHEKGVTEETTVRDVEELVHDHLRQAQKIFEPEIEALREKMYALGRESRSIRARKAQAVVVAAFPEAASGTYLAPPRHHWGYYQEDDFYCFSLGEGFGHTIFVVRKVGGEPPGGIARIKMPGDAWHRLSSEQQYQAFWGAIAKAFAARELKIPEADLHDACVGIRAKTLGELASDDTFPPSAEAVSIEAPGGYVTVTFDANSLPVTAVFTPEKQPSSN